MKRLKRLEQFIKTKGTILALNPLSKELVDVIIEYANKNRFPIMITASRRQIDSKTFGGGYVQGWNSKKLVDYIKKRDKGNYIVICRDHGGPWQNEKEKYLSLKEALISAKRSFIEDINAGYEFIHIDMSKDRSLKAEKNMFNLYRECLKHANRIKKDIEFEI